MKLTSTLPTLLVLVLATGAAAQPAQSGKLGTRPSDTVCPTPIGIGPAYPGPKDIVPAGPSPSLPSGRPSATPSTPRPAQPLPGQPPSAPLYQRVPTTDPTLQDIDSGAWRHWWELNKEPYLNLRRAVREAGVVTGSDDFFLGNGPTLGRRNSAVVRDETFAAEILPTLAQRLEEEHSSALLAASLLALGQAGAGRDQGVACTALIAPFLDDPRRPVAEAATVALGVLGDPAGLDVLEHLLYCSTGGLQRDHELGFGQHVPSRQRAFAAYSLGLIGARNDDYVRARVVNRLTAAILNDRHGGADEVRAAAVLAIGIAPLRPSSQPFDLRRRPSFLVSRQEQVRWLLGALDEPRLSSRVRAMVPTSLGRLLADVGDDSALRDVTLQRLTALLERHSGERSDVRRSCALALGWIADCDDDPYDEGARDALIEATRELPDQQTRHFALVALGRAAGRPGTGGDPLAGANEAREVLLRSLARGSTPVRPWSALGAAVLERSLDDLQRSSSEHVKAALRAALNAARTPDEIGACAIAVGITRNPRAAAVLREKLARVRDTQARGDLAVALGMVGDTSATEALRALCEGARSQPALQGSAAVGLVLIGDKGAADTLGALFGEAKSLATQGSLLAALARAGDARSIDLLTEAATSRARTSAARARAIAALGCVAEEAELPWTAYLSVGASYLSGVETLTSLPRGLGIVDVQL
jgi:HEAT repeat protein